MTTTAIHYAEATVALSGLVIVTVDGRPVGSWRPTRDGLEPYDLRTPEWSRRLAEAKLADPQAPAVMPVRSLSEEQ